jgi:hypothetical protein
MTLLVVQVQEALPDLEERCQLGADYDDGRASQALSVLTQVRNHLHTSTNAVRHNVSQYSWYAFSTPVMLHTSFHALYSFRQVFIAYLCSGCSTAVYHCVAYTACNTHAAVHASTSCMQQ